MTHGHRQPRHSTLRPYPPRRCRTHTASSHPRSPTAQTLSLSRLYQIHTAATHRPSHSTIMKRLRLRRVQSAPTPCTRIRQTLFRATRLAPLVGFPRSSRTSGQRRRRSAPDRRTRGTMRPHYSLTIKWRCLCPWWAATTTKMSCGEIFTDTWTLGNGPSSTLHSYLTQGI